MPMLPTGLHRHPKTGVYYYRQRIPADILSCYSGRREVICSLRTKSRHEAILRLRVKQSAATVEWETHRQRKADQAAKHQIEAVTVLNTLSDEAIAAICSNVEAGALEADEKRRLSDDPYDPDEIEEYRSGYAAANVDMRVAAATGDLSPLMLPLKQYLWMLKVDVRAPEGDMRRLALAFCRAAIRANERLLRRYDGEDVPTPQPTWVLSTPGLSKVVAAYVKYYGLLDKAAMLKKVEAALQLLLEIVGDKPIGLLRQKDLETYFETIQHLPPRWKDACRKRKVTPLELAKLRVGEISKATFEGTYVAVLGPFVDYCRVTWQDEGWSMNLTVQGVRYTGSRRDPEAGQRAFKPEELQRLFCGPEMAGFAHDPAQAHKFWLPHVGLFTGARVNEICQLNPCTDIRQDRRSGVWYLDITAESDGPDGVVKSVKTKGSKRRVPVHSKLIELGFLQYVEGMKGKGCTLLFPGFPPSRGRASPRAAKWFRDLLSATELRDETPDARISGMHAFRHTVLHTARVLGVVNAEAITGHAGNVTGIVAVQGDQTQGAKSAVVRRYEGELPVAQKAEILERIHYGDLEFYKPVTSAAEVSTPTAA